MPASPLPLPQRKHHRWGLADFFDTRRKSLFTQIANMKPADVLYDLGSGDASLLIYAVKKCGLRRAVGFENMQSRAKRARSLVKKAGLGSRIVIENDLYDADLSKADVIFDMLPEAGDELNSLYSPTKGIRVGTRLVRHDLPLIGFLPDKVVLPFYLMRYPFRRAASRNQWAESVLLESGTTPNQVWRELYYYSYEKGYDKGEIRNFASLLRKRVR